MTCLLDELQRLNENGLGFGSDEGSAVVSCVLERWASIYGTWGSLSSLKTYNEPWLVNFLRAALLFSYALLIPNRYKSLINEDDNIYFNMSMLLCVVELGIFTLMWYLAYAIRNPFRPTLFIRGLQRTSLITQKQVIMFLAERNFKRWDDNDYISGSKYGWIKDRFGKKALGLGSLSKVDEDEGKEDRRPVIRKSNKGAGKVSDANDGLPQKTFVRFKNVNF